jgi:hypothetical protein
MPPVGFEPKIPVSERPQTHALDRAATGIGLFKSYYIIVYQERLELNEQLVYSSYLKSSKETHLQMALNISKPQHKSDVRYSVHLTSSV